MVEMKQSDKTDERRSGEPYAEGLFRQQVREKMTAVNYNRLDGLGSFLREYKPFEDGNPKVVDLMKFYDVKLEYAKDLMRRKAGTEWEDPYRKSLKMLEIKKTPQTVNTIYYMMKMSVGKSSDQKDSEIVLALEACRDTFNYINERTKSERK